MESARNPLALLPEECWERIFAWIGDPADLLNCSRTCQLWNDILDSKKTVWLFPTVFPQLVSHLTNTDLLTCRQVSKSWKASIDRHLEEGGQFDVSDNREDEAIFWNAVKLDFSKFEDPRAEVKRLEEQVGDSARNPIPSRTVSLDNNPDYALEFLRTFGVHVWHLTINSRQNNRTRAIDFITAIREYLVCTPNLRTLILTANNFSGTLEQVEDGTFLRFFDENPLPPLPHLRSLVVYLFPRVTSDSMSFEQHFVSTYAPSLQRFQLWQYDHIFLPDAAPNLTHLHCEIGAFAHLNAVGNLNAPY